MSQVNVQKMRERILQEKSRLEHDREQLRANDGMSNEVGESTDFDMNHPADSGSETFERTKDLALRASIDGELAQIEVALAKMDAGTYGICDNCGESIPAGRLDAIPYATLCVTCQDRLENTQ